MRLGDNFLIKRAFLPMAKVGEGAGAGRKNVRLAARLRKATTRPSVDLKRRAGAFADLR